MDDSPIRFGVKKRRTPAPSPIYVVPARCSPPSVLEESEERVGLYNPADQYRSHQELPRQDPQHPQQQEHRWISPTSSRIESIKDEEWSIKFLTREDFYELTHSSAGPSSAGVVGASATEVYGGEVGYHHRAAGAHSTTGGVNCSLHPEMFVTRPLTSTDDNDWVPFAAVECYGEVEPYCFNAVDSNFIIKSKVGKTFEPINLECGGNWSEFDEEFNHAVIVAELEGKWERYDAPQHLPGSTAA